MSGAIGDWTRQGAKLDKPVDSTPLVSVGNASSSTSTPLGIGGDKGSIGPAAARAASSTEGVKRLKEEVSNIADFLLENEEVDQEEYASSGDERLEKSKVAVKQAEVSSLLKTTVKEVETFIEIYKALAEGPLKDVLDADGPAYTAKALVRHMFTLPRIFSTLKSNGEQMRKEVHPLAFLLLLQKNDQIQACLNTISSQDYQEKWKSKLEKLSKWVGQDTRSPWERTWADLGADIQKHQQENSLYLEDFFKALPENKRELARRHIAEEKWEELLRLMIR